VTATSDEWHGLFLEPYVSTEESTYVEFQLGSHMSIHIGVTTLIVEPNDWKDISLSNLLQAFDCGLLGSGAKFCNIGLHILYGNLFVYINGNIFDSKNPIICNLPLKFRFFLRILGSGASVQIVTLGSSVFSYEPPRVSDVKVKICKLFWI
jgi:hypothetical protein